MKIYSANFVRHSYDFLLNLLVLSLNMKLSGAKWACYIVLCGDFKWFVGSFKTNLAKK